MHTLCVCVLEATDKSVLQALFGCARIIHSPTLVNFACPGVFGQPSTPLSRPRPCDGQTKQCCVKALAVTGVFLFMDGFRMKGDAKVSGCSL